MRFALNPLAERSAYTSEEAQIVSCESAQRARHEISRWPGYAVTPLRSLEGLAGHLGVASLLYKDEGERLGQRSFKVLGGAYAAMLCLRSHEASDTPTLCCATDGNHGASVAYAAKQHGCHCVVFMHENAPVRKAAAIRQLGAEVVVTSGTYDDSVRIAASTAGARGWLLVPDTSDNPRDQTALHVMQGYGVMVLEMIEQFATTGTPSHVLIQAGVGGLAAAVAAIMSDHYGKKRPTLIAVEPEAAACLLESNLRLRPAKIAGDLLTEMAMLSTGSASAAAWPILERRIDVFLAIRDALALSAHARLTDATSGDPPMDVGISGAGGVAGLMQLRACSRLSRLIGLSQDSRVAVIGTESGRDEIRPTRPIEGAANMRPS